MEGTLEVLQELEPPVPNCPPPSTPPTTPLPHSLTLTLACVPIIIIISLSGYGQNGLLFCCSPRDLRSHIVAKIIDVGYFWPCSLSNIHNPFAIVWEVEKLEITANIFEQGGPSRVHTQHMQREKNIGGLERMKNWWGEISPGVRPQTTAKIAPKWFPILPSTLLPNLLQNLKVMPWITSVAERAKEEWCKKSRKRFDRLL